MREAINWVVGRFSSFFGFLGQLEVVAGVSMLGIMVAVYILGVLINQLVRRAGV